jgi:antitoxin ParD1/3/4
MTKVQKLSISLPKEMVDSIRYAVDSGQYASTSEVVREAVREWKGPKKREIPERMRVPQTKEEFRRRIQDAVDSLDRGEGIPAETLHAELRARFGTSKQKTKRRA